MRRFGHLVVAIAVSLVVGAAAPWTALAEQAASSAPATATVTIPMNVDCSQLPTGPAARAYLTKYNLCGFGAQTFVGISPDTTVSGNCGTLSLTVQNGGQGHLYWMADITSSLGPFVAANYTGQWTNTTTHAQGPVNRSFLGLTSNWYDAYLILTGSGWDVGYIGFAKDVTFWGLICTDVMPVDSSVWVTSY